VQRAADGAEDVLHRDQVRHLFLGDAEDDLAPDARSLPVGVGQVRAAERVRGVEVLHHQRVLDFRGDVEKEDGVVEPLEIFGKLDVAVRGEAEETDVLVALRRTKHRLQVPRQRAAHIPRRDSEGDIPYPARFTALAMPSPPACATRGWQGRVRR
jgi:hypothetical protein